MTVGKEHTKFKPRFDFGSNLDPENNQTGTISELLTEINKAYNPRSGEPANFKSLKPTRDLINKVTGINFSRATDQIPLLALKTIKLLFMVNHESTGMNLLSRIRPPTEIGKTKTKSDKPSMESATTSSIARDKSAAATIHNLSDQLAKEIEAEKLNSFYDLIKNTERSPAEELNAHIERTNDEIYRLLIGRFGNDNIRLADACLRLAKEIDCLNYKKVEGAEPPPINEAIFAHLKGLGFIHFALHHRKFVKEIQVTETIHPIDTEINALCQSLSEGAGRTVLPNERIFSVNDFHHLVAGYHREFIHLVKVATTFGTRKPSLFENTLRSRKILSSYVYRSYDETDLNARRLSVLDIAAALCSVRYQQAVKTKYEPLWSGQVSPGKSPQRNFDGTDSNDPYMHQGVFQIYFYRFHEYLAAFTERTESHNAWLKYQISRFDAYSRILKIHDINGIVTSAHHFDHVCTQEAMAISRNPFDAVQ